MQEKSTAIIEPQDRSPLEFPFGLFIADATNYGGAEGFAWFGSESSALDYLRNELWQLYDEEGDEPESDLRDAIATALDGVSALKQIPKEHLNKSQALFELRWVGSLEDLRTGKDPFEEEIQNDYRENASGDASGTVESDMENFADHLLSYHG